MAVVGTAREIRVRGEVGEISNFQFTREFIVQCDSMNDGPVVASNATGLPQLYDSYTFGGTESNIGARMTGLSVDPIDDAKGYYWKCVCTYTTLPIDLGNSGTTTSGSQSGAGTPTDPELTSQQTAPNLRPWTITFGSNKFTKPLYPYDLDGVEVKNSAGQYFDPAPERPVSRPTINIECFSNATAATLYSKVASYTDAVNSDIFLGFAARTLRCTEYSVQSQYEAGAYYYKLNVTLEVNLEKWNPMKVLNAGTLFRNSASEPLQPILDKSGQPVTTPVPLAADGKLLAPGAPLVYIDFKAYVERVFQGNLIV